MEGNTMNSRSRLAIKHIEPSQEDDFKKVYQAAKKRDVKTLRDLQSKLCIDLRSINHYSPASQLAFEKNRASAEFLRTEFGAHVSEIAAGAVYGGDTEYAEYLRIHHGASLRDILESAAKAKNYSYIESLIPLIEMNQEYYSVKPIHFSYLAEGAAFSDNQQLAEFYRVAYQIDPTLLARAAVRGGRIEYAEYLRTQHEASASQIALEASAMGYHNYVDHLRSQAEVSLVNVASGAAFTNQKQQAERIRTFLADNNEWIGFNAAKGGQRHYAEFLREQGTPVDTLACGAIKGEYFDYAEYLYKEHGASLSGMALAAFDSRIFTNEKTTLHTLIFIKDDTFREAIIKSIPTPYYFEFPLQIHERRATHVNALIETQHLNHTQALAWTTSELQTWFLQGIQLVQKNQLSTDTFFLISSFLSPLREMSGKECIDVQQKMFHHLRPNFFNHVRRKNNKRKRARIENEDFIPKKRKV